MIFASSSFIKALFAFGSATDTFPEPRTTIAFRFLLPITAPTPLRPAALYRSFMIAAIRLRCSPAGPIVRTLALESPNRSSRRSVVSPTSLPQ